MMMMAVLMNGTEHHMKRVYVTYYYYPHQPNGKFPSNAMDNNTKCVCVCAAADERNGNNVENGKYVGECESFGHFYVRPQYLVATIHCIQY